MLTIQGNDTVSGITAVTVNGTTYTDLKDGMLRVQLTQKDFTTKQIEITVTDGAGNTSEKYVLQNPYYEWAKKQAEKQKSSSDSNGAMATTTSADAMGTEKQRLLRFRRMHRLLSRQMQKGPWMIGQ